MKNSTSKVYLKLTELGTRKEAVLTVLSKIQGLSDTPEQLIANLPCHISGEVSRSLAEKVKEYLAKAGAKVEIVDIVDTAHDAELPDAPPNPMPEFTHFDHLDEHVTATDGSAQAAWQRDQDLEMEEQNVVVFETDTSSPAPTPRVAAQMPAPRPPETPPDPVEKSARPLRKARRPSVPRAVWWAGLLMLLLAGIAALWYAYAMRAASPRQTAGVFGQQGTLIIENPSGAELSLYHVVGTKVITRLPLDGLKINLPAGDYYIEARQGAQTLRFPAYLHGWRHRVFVNVSFPVALESFPKLAYIPSGWFRLGNKETGVAHFGFPDEKPDIDVYVTEFLISKYEVTNQEFAEFVAAGGYQKDLYWERLIQDWPSLVAQVPDYGDVFGNHGWDSVRRYIHTEFIDTDHRPGPRLWEDDTPPYDYGRDAHPVIGISLYEADAYCKWRTQQTGKLHRLPTEAEWEKAARGFEGYFFAYGNEYDPTKANTELGDPRRVGSYPPNSYGVYDMTGNVWEWVADQYREDAYQMLLDTYGTEIRDPRVFDETKRYARGILRGGSYRSVNRINARIPMRYPMFPNDWHTNIGFRYVVVP